VFVVARLDAGECRFQFIQNLLDPRAFWFMETLERLGHEIIANSGERERALDAFDDG
jgi:hypothetical protein